MEMALSYRLHGAREGTSASHWLVLICAKRVEASRGAKGAEEDVEGRWAKGVSRLDLLGNVQVQAVQVGRKYIFCATNRD